MWKYILYIVLIALTTMALIYVGILKDKNLNVDLVNKLYYKCYNKVLKYLKDGKEVTAVQIRELIGNEKVGVVWSRKKLAVTNKTQFTNLIINGLIKNEKIQIIEGKIRKYKLK